MSVFQVGDKYTWVRGAVEYRVTIMAVCANLEYMVEIEGQMYQWLRVSERELLQA